ncbi:MAG: DegV family protein [Clostridia bacterium]
MPGYTLVSDSTCDISPELIAQLEIKIIPLTFHVGENTYLNLPDASTLPFDEFYNELRVGATVSTSQINVVEFIEEFEKLLVEGQDVLYLAFSSGLSGTCNSACIAAEDLREKYPQRRVIVVDSLAASMGEGLLAYHAAKMRQDGADIETVAQWLNDNKLHLAHWFTVDDLNHLKRGGRVSPALAFVGTLLGIKPVLHVDNDGHLIPVSKVRGRRASLDALVAKMKETCPNPQEQVIFISHGDAREDAEYVANAVREQMHVREVFINYIGPVIGAHSGPGTIALFFLANGR